MHLQQPETRAAPLSPSQVATLGRLLAQFKRGLAGDTKALASVTRAASRRSPEAEMFERLVLSIVAKAEKRKAA
jgi:hypothetical protein